MAGPYDYTIQQPDIAGSLMGGIQMGQQFGAQRDAREAAEAQRLKQQQYSADLQSYLDKPTAQSASAMMAKYPEFQKSMSASFETFDKGQKEDIFKVGTQAYSAIQNGRPEIAMKILDDRIAATQNAGQDTTDLESLKQSLSQNPEAAAAGLALTMSSLNPEGFSKIASEERASKLAPYELGKARAESGIKQVEARYAPEKEFLGSAKSRADIKNTISMANDRADRLGLDRDRLNSDIDAKINELGQKASALDDGAKKLINEGAINSVTADQAAGRMLDLASRLEAEGGGYGAFSNANEYVSNVFGNQDALTDMRKEYTRLRSMGAIKSLPPGPATDRDISLAMEGWLSPSADAKTLASFVKGMAKLSQIEAVNENAKSEWVNSVGHLGKPKRDIEVDGVQVPAGTTFADFSKDYIDKKFEQRAAEQAQQNVPKRSYMKYANPAGGQ